MKQSKHISSEASNSYRVLSLKPPSGRQVIASGCHDGDFLVSSIRATGWPHAGHKQSRKRAENKIHELIFMCSRYDCEEQFEMFAMNVELKKSQSAAKTRSPL